MLAGQVNEFAKSLSTSGPDELLVRLNVTGICFTDIHYAMGDMAFPKMQEFGVRSPGQWVVAYPQEQGQITLG